MPIVLFFTIADADGDKSRVELPIDETGITLANMAAILEAVWDLMNPLVNGQLVTAGFSLETDISGFTNVAAGALADVQEKAEFVFRTASGFVKRLNIPTFVETLFGSAGASKEVNLADTGVAAFVTALEDGITVTAQAVTFVDSRGDELDALESAVENWGKRRT